MRIDTRKLVRNSAIAVVGSMAAICSASSWAQPPAAGTGGDANASSQPSESEDVLDGLIDSETGETPAPEAPADQPGASPTAEPASTQPASEIPPETIPVAQRDNEPPPAAPKEASNGRQLEEIVVTATKREERLRDIPQSITAYSGEDLEKQGKLNLYDYVLETPGVTASQGANGQMRLTMRGINTDASPYSGLASPVGVFIGDVPFSDSYIVSITPDLSAFDLSDVAVLKGPQGTLFGGAALSGAIRYQLQDPVLGEWQGRAFTQYVKPHGGSTAFTSGVAANLPLYDDKLALRLVYVDRNLPGVVDDLRSGEKDVDEGEGAQIRAILLWQPTEDLKIKLTHLDQDFSADSLQVPNSPDERTDSLTVLPKPVKNDFGMDALEVAYEFSDMRFTSLTSRVVKNSWNRSDSTFIVTGPPPPGYPEFLGIYSEGVSNADSFNQELRLQSTGSGPFQWLAGAYYNKYKMHFTTEIATVLGERLTDPGGFLATLAGFLGVPLGALDNLQLLNGLSDASSEERALFADVKYTLWDDLDLGAGVRVYRTHLDGGFIGKGIVVRLQNNGQNTDTTSTLTETGINPKLSATYRFSDDASLYAAASRGFRFGGINTLPSTATNNVPAAYKSDSIWNYELGLRTDWLDRTLRADATLFYIRYKDPFIGQKTSGPLGLAYTDNVSAAISKGIEGSLTWNTPLEGLNLSVSGILMEAYISEPFESSSGKTIEPGTQMPGSARYQYTGRVQYLRPVGATVAGFNSTYTYVGKGFTDIEHNGPINGYGTLNAGFTLNSSDLPLKPSLAINVSNVLDVVEANARARASSITQVPLTINTLCPPRTVTVRIGFEF